MQARAKPRIEVVEIVHAERDAAGGEVEHLEILGRTAVRRLEAHAQPAGPGNDEIGGAVLGRRTRGGR